MWWNNNIETNQSWVDKGSNKSENQNSSSFRIAILKILELVNKWLSPLDWNTAMLWRNKKKK